MEHQRISTNQLSACCHAFLYMLQGSISKCGKICIFSRVKLTRNNKHCRSLAVGVSIITHQYSVTRSGQTYTPIKIYVFCTDDSACNRSLFE